MPPLEFSQVQSQAISILKRGGVGVLATDTIYGLVGSALKPETVQRIYHLKNRDRKKQFIVLISSIEDLNKFGVKLSSADKVALKKFWPGSVSIVLPVLDEKFKYLHHSSQNIAFRIPAKKLFLEILKQTGPLVATSVNVEGEKPATDIAQAKKYFNDQLDFYIDEGPKVAKVSKIIKIEGKKITYLR